MKQQTLAMAADQNAGFEQFRKPTRRDEFLNTMNVIIPWAEMASVIEPLHPKGVGGRGLAKNATRAFTALALANVFLVRGL